MDRLFLDANILFSAAYRPNARMLRIWALRECVLYSSAYAVAEARTNLSEDSQSDRLQEICLGMHFVNARSSVLPPGILLPEKDVPILMAAIEANATHLLTGDVQHFGRFFGKKIGAMLVQLPGEYLKGREDPVD